MTQDRKISRCWPRELQVTCTQQGATREGGVNEAGTEKYFTTSLESLGDLTQQGETGG